jgi:hypothetical protein
VGQRRIASRWVWLLRWRNRAARLESTFCFCKELQRGVLSDKRSIEVRRGESRGHVGYSLGLEILYAGGLGRGFVRALVSRVPFLSE